MRSFTIYKYCTWFKRSRVFQKSQLPLCVYPYDSSKQYSNKYREDLAYHSYKYKCISQIQPVFKELKVSELFNSFPTILSYANHFQILRQASGSKALLTILN